MNVLVACEFSGIVRDAFTARGHDAISCDLLPTESPGPHIQGDVAPLLKYEWDLIIAHPPCRYLCNSGVRWLHEQPGRWGKMVDAAKFFQSFLTDTRSEFLAVENPVMHRWAEIRKHDFTIQPWEFGEPYTKRTCFWTRNLPPLEPTNILDTDQRHPAVHYESPGPDRWKRRSVTYQGIADAMADQWGSIL